MEKDWNAEIERIDAELTQIKKMLIRKALPATKPTIPPGGKAVLSPDDHARLVEIRDQLMAFGDETHETGAVAYAGSFEADGRHSLWAMSFQTDYLLSLNAYATVEKVLASIGNSQRLAILLALLKQPMTVTQLVEALEAKSTGLVYHHLKPLVMADIVYEEKGLYAVKPYRVQGIIMLLAAVRDLTDASYSSGSWEETQPD